MPFEQGQRVRLIDDSDDPAIHLGTVTHVTRGGYTTVKWDENTGCVGYTDTYSPRTAHIVLQPVSGRMAHPRHIWKATVENPTAADFVCTRGCGCKAIDKPDNTWAPCPGPKGADNAD